MSDYRITDIETLRLLSDPMRLAILELLAEPATVTALADELGVPRTRLYRHLHRLEEAGLVKTVQTRQVRGTTESSYQAVADRFVPTPELLADAPLDDVAEAALGVIFDTTRAELGARIRSGAISLNQSQSPQRTLSLGRQVVRLTDRQAEELMEEMEKVVARLSSESAEATEDTSPHVFQYVVYRGGGTLG
ncbi:MAG: winged helix-turn-helix domain-containing protein [Acidimicrobiia bacterium]|nr:winged helix-turn-helix domain-containing protein [Acidimicrobiia bacterium]